METVFQKIDRQTKSYYGFNPFAVFWNINSWRKYFLFCVITSLICWITLGFDSTWAMLEPFINGFIPLLLGETTFTEIWKRSQSYYGVGNHFSAPVIYGLAFILLSKYLEDKYNITKSLNFFTTTSLTFMNIGVFEWAWNLLYSNLQNQPWTIQFKWKQIGNLSYFTAFIALGICAIIYLYSEGYHPNFGKMTAIYLTITVGLFLLWIFYPFQIGYVSVNTTTGVWTNTDLFPQTMYAVDIDPLDDLAIGVPYFVKNSFLHMVNVLAKIFTTATIFSFCKVLPIKTFINIYKSV